MATSAIADFDIAFPVLAFTPIGIVPYTSLSRLSRCMVREYRMGWYNELEIIDSCGMCFVIHGAVPHKVPWCARLFGKQIEVQIVQMDCCGELAISAIRDRVREFMEIYSHQFIARGDFERIVKMVDAAATASDVIVCFLD
jgi:hypothetical protein